MLSFAPPAEPPPLAPDELPFGGSALGVGTPAADAPPALGIPSVGAELPPAPLLLPLELPLAPPVDPALAPPAAAPPI